MCVDLFYLCYFSFELYDFCVPFIEYLGLFGELVPGGGEYFYFPPECSQLVFLHIDGIFVFVSDPFVF